MRGYFIAGTDTGVGKTRVTAGLAAGFKALGVRVVASKPVSTGGEHGPGGKISPDFALIASFSGQNPQDRRAFPYVLDPPVSPDIAADRAGICIDLAHIAIALRDLSIGSQMLLVEGTGGWLAPLTPTHTMADVARDLGCPVILVVGLRLGCLNHALLTAQAIAASGLALAGWVGNRVDPAMLEPQANLDTLTARLGAAPLAVLPHDAAIDSSLPPLRAAARRLWGLGSAVTSRA